MCDYFDRELHQILIKIAICLMCEILDSFMARPLALPLQICIQAGSSKTPQLLAPTNAACGIYSNVPYLGL